jgi:hypothetical protein
MIRNGFGITPGEKVTSMTPLIWLPKLDQLMEEAQLPGMEFREMTFVFYDWVKHPYGRGGLPAGKHFSSLEQVWLAFIMMKKHNKLWANDNWHSMEPPHSVLP